ncbi:MAG TPA: TonB family protein, partial [Terriglobales bacterium]|nr:TonB family protein [Terriglobales bacterium]
LKQWLAGSESWPVQESMGYDAALAARIACLGDLADLQATISSQQLDRDTALDLIVKRMAELTRATGAAIALQEDQDVVCRATFGNAPDVGVKLSATSLSGECLRTGNVVLLDDSENDPRVDPEICRQLNFRSLLILPVVSGTSRIGIAEVLSPTPDHFEGRDVLVVSFLADLIANVSAPAPREDEASARMNPPTPDGFDVEGGDLLSAPLNISNRLEDTVKESASSNQEFADAISQPSEFAFEKAVPSAPPAAEESIHERQRGFARAHGQPITANDVAPVFRPAERKAVTAPKIRQAPGKVNAIFIGGAILLVVALALAFYLWLHRSTAPTGKGANPLSPAGSVASAAVLPSPATSPGATSTAATTPAPKPVRTAALREAAAPSAFRPSSSAARELDVIQTSTRSANKPAPEAVPDAPSLNLTSSSSNALAAAVVAAKTPAPELGLVQSQGVTEGKLITKVLPRYPELARRAGITGDVVLTGTIGTDGKLKNLKVLSGSPMLREEAIAAAKQWRYTPYLLGGKPVETETHITINFHH